MHATHPLRRPKIDEGKLQSVYTRINLFQINPTDTPSRSIVTDDSEMVTPCIGEETSPTWTGRTDSLFSNAKSSRTESTHRASRPADGTELRDLAAPLPVHPDQNRASVERTETSGRMEPGPESEAVLIIPYCLYSCRLLRTLFVSLRFIIFCF